MNKSRLFISAVAAVLIAIPTLGESIVILHSNDTHSQIDTDSKGIGGALQRKAIIDSVRNAEKNVILVDAGDVVQGSLYFKFFKGEVEYPLMDLMGYEIRILGNHEFDNGIDDISKYYKQTKGTPLSANYDFSETDLDGVFSPYTIREVDGKKIGFFGINIDPSSLIRTESIGNMKYSDAVSVANETAAFLKNEMNCDLVVAVTHIGAEKKNAKATDYDLAAASKDIDIIIGGHSHTVILPGTESDDKPGLNKNFPSIVKNALGEPVLVVQTGKNGVNLGYIKVDLDEIGNARNYDYRLIPVTDRFSPDQYDKNIIEFLAPYKEVVDSVNSRVIARSAGEYPNGQATGALANFTADMAFNIGTYKADSIRLTNPDFPTIDFAFMNVGGIRKTMKAGDVTEGQILDTYPFSNFLMIASIKGSDLAEALKVAATKGGESVSSHLNVLMDSGLNVKEILLNGYPLDPDSVYNFVTISYVVEGNDDLISMANSRILWEDEVEVAAPILKYVEDMGKRGMVINPDERKRFFIVE